MSKETEETERMPISPSAKSLDTPLVPERESDGRAIYDIEELEEGGFEVTLPGLFSPALEAIVGTRTEWFATREEAEQTVERSRQSDAELFEQASLEKNYGTELFRIDRLPEGRYCVVLPGLRMAETGHYLGISRTTFDSWAEAKDYFLEIRKDQEALTSQPLLEVQTSSNETIAFSELAAFHPDVAPSERPVAIPPTVEKYLMGKGRLEGSQPSAGTYQETIKEPGWEAKLFSFVSTYLQQEGSQIAQELGIQHLDALTPKQAIELATGVVVELTKYKYSDIRHEATQPGEEPEGTKADQSSALHLLRQGLVQRNNPDWDGNGVCRNFASAVKAVFEAVKANQTRFSRLHDTYALYDGGEDEFAPRRGSKNVMEMNRKGHAWNTFVTVSSEGAANATIVDATWAKKDLDTGKIKGLDYTLTRMEPVVYAVGKDLPKAEASGQLGHILSYYALKLEGLRQAAELPAVDSLEEAQRVHYREAAMEAFGAKYDLSGRSQDQLVVLGQKVLYEINLREQHKQENQFFAGRAVDLLRRQAVPDELPPVLVEAVNREYQELAGEADVSEIETVYEMGLKHPGIDVRRILRGYLETKPLSDYGASQLIFSNNGLQRLVFEEIKLRDGFDALLKESPSFRIRTREVVPQIFIDFSPGTKPEDARELRQLIRESQWFRHNYTMVDPRYPSEAKAAAVFERARKKLRLVNPDRYDDIAGGLDDYQLIKQYDHLANQLSADTV